MPHTRVLVSSGNADELNGAEQILEKSNPRHIARV